MNILGIQTGHNSTVALIIDSKLRAAISEEKFVNIKNYSGFPLNAIKHMLVEYNLTPNDIDFVAISSHTNILRLPNKNSNEGTKKPKKLSG